MTKVKIDVHTPFNLILPEIHGMPEKPFQHYEKGQHTVTEKVAAHPWVIQHSNAAQAAPEAAEEEPAGSDEEEGSAEEGEGSEEETADEAEAREANEKAEREAAEANNRGKRGRR